MFRLALNRSLRPIVDRGNLRLPALLSFDLSLPGWQNVDLRSGRTTGEIPCIARYYDGHIVSLDMASVGQPEDPSTLWARNECLVSQREAEKFVNEVISYLRSTGGRGGGGLVNRLYKCLQQVAFLSSVFGSFSVRVSLPPHNHASCGAQESRSDALCFICNCVECISPDTEHQPEANTVAHALLDCIPANIGLQTELTQRALSSGATLFWQLLDPAHSRLAVKLAQASRHLPGTLLTHAYN